MLNPINKDNAREVEMMVGKAMCAYANWMKIAHNREKYEAEFGNVRTVAEIAACKSEYEATIRILDFFVEESFYEIQRYVPLRAYAELEI